MERPTLKAQFGVSNMEILDAWPSKSADPFLAKPAGVDNGASYLSFPLTDEQKAFLGNTEATHIRLEIRELK